MSLTKNQKFISKLLLLRRVEEQRAIIKHVLSNNKKNKVREMYSTREVEGFFSVLIEKKIHKMSNFEN